MSASMLGEALRPVFPIWRTITLGAFKSVKSLRKALKQSGFRIGSWARQLLVSRAFTLAGEETEVDLVRITVAELGFPKGATLQKIYDRAQELGLELCPAEVGPALRLQYPDQPRGELLTVAMEPIADSVDSPCVFCVELIRVVRRLDVRRGYSGYFRPGDSQFVFVSK